MAICCGCSTNHGSFARGLTGLDPRGIRTTESIRTHAMAGTAFIVSSHLLADQEFAQACYHTVAASECCIASLPTCARGLERDGTSR